MTTYLPHIKLAHIATGQAEVRLFTPDVAFGESRSLGWVVRSTTGRWVAQDRNRVPVKSFPSRRAAVDFLARHDSLLTEENR